MRERNKLSIDHLPNEVHLAIAWGKDSLAELYFVVDAAVTCRILGLGLAIAIYQGRAHNRRLQLLLAAKARNRYLPG